MNILDNRARFVLLLFQIIFLSLHGMDDSVPCRKPKPIDILSRRPGFHAHLAQQGIDLQVDTQKSYPVDPIYLERLIAFEQKKKNPSLLSVSSHVPTPWYRSQTMRSPIESAVPTDQ